jgi:hypothetical protein
MVVILTVILEAAHRIILNKYVYQAYQGTSPNVFSPLDLNMEADPAFETLLNSWPEMLTVQNFSHKYKHTGLVIP